MTDKERDRLVRAIERYARARVDNSWKGGGDPDDIPRIERRLKRASADLNKLIDELHHGELQTR